MVIPHSIMVTVDDEPSSRVAPTEVTAHPQRTAQIAEGQISVDSIKSFVPSGIANDDSEAGPWRGILLIEPALSILGAQTAFFTDAHYRVTPAFSCGELFVLRHAKAVALAIISDRLGHAYLGTAATFVRRQWPRARILLMGKALPGLEDHLYDERVDHSSDPGRLLADVEGLYKGMWNRRTYTIDWSAGRAACSLAKQQIVESDPSKALPVRVEDKDLRGKPSDVRRPATNRN